MIIDEIKKQKRLMVVERRLADLDAHYTRMPDDAVLNYAQNIVRNECQVVTLAYRASAYAGLDVRELFIDGSVYAISSVMDILPSVVWHLNTYKGEYIIAFDNDKMMPWIRRKNPHLDIGYSIYSGNVEFEVDSVTDAVYKAQRLLLLCGIELDRIAVCFSGNRRSEVIELRMLREMRRHAKTVAEKERSARERRAALEVKNRRKALQDQRNDKRRRAKATERAAAAQRIVRWSGCQSSSKVLHPRKSHVDMAALMSEISSPSGAAWNTYRGTPVFVTCGGTVGSRQEVLSGEDSF